MEATDAIITTRARKSDWRQKAQQLHEEGISPTKLADDLYLLTNPITGSYHEVRHVDGEWTCATCPAGQRGMTCYAALWVREIEREAQKRAEYLDLCAHVDQMHGMRVA